MNEKHAVSTIPMALTEDEARYILNKRGGEDAPALSEIVLPVGRVTVLEAERQLVVETLRQVGGHRGRACAALGISRPTLTRKLKAYEVELKKGGAA